MSKKSQSFGFDILVTATALLLFNQLMINSTANVEDVLILQHNIENNQLLYLALAYNNSVSLFNSYACNNNTVSLQMFKDNALHVLETYVQNREYLLSAGDEVVSSEGVETVCLSRASPAVFQIHSSCGTVLTFQFSIYTTGEKREC